VNRSYPEGTWLLLCTTAVEALWRIFNTLKSAQEKTPKGGTKGDCNREDHDRSAGGVKNFRKAGDATNHTAG
jgi:hypothetical protein